MKKHSKIYKVLTVLVTVVITVMGARADVFAVSTSIECGYTFCSNNLIADGPYKAGSTVSSSVPVYGGSLLTGIDSSFSNKKYHYTLLYCSEFGTGTLKKRHSFGVAESYHRYTIPTDEYKPVQVGDYIVDKFRNNDGSTASAYDYNPATGKYDILSKYVTDINVPVWHFRKYLCGKGSLSGVVNKSSGDTITFDDAKAATDKNGCGESEYFIEYHDNRKIYHGHIAEDGHFFYEGDDGKYITVYGNDLEYDSSRNGYILPNTDYCISQKPDYGDSYTIKGIAATNSSGAMKIFNYIPKQMVCVIETRCDICGWQSIAETAGYDETSITVKDASSHHILTKCKTCGEIYVDKDVDHNFSYGEYTPVISDTGKSTQHSVTRTCISKLNSPSCGYSDTIKEDHTWEYSDCTSVDGKTHKTVRTCTKCGYCEEASENHSLVYGDWTDNGEVNHIRTVSCDTCRYESTETQNHNFITKFEQYSSTHHKVTETCDCGHINIFYEEHKDNDHDNCCDECGYISSIFSVTVPATMYLVMAKDGSVYSADNAEIINNSTGSVSVKEITVEGQNNWRVVPYTTEMANQKVDSKLIGFSIRDQQTMELGKSTVFYPGDDWNIDEGESLPLPYNAIVSATSNPIENKQVLNITFVVDWGDS